jgi:hypothetical protein
MRIAAGVFLILAGAAAAETFCVPLDVAGAYIEGYGVEIEFDLGVGLLQVYETRFVCEGSITAGLDIGMTRTRGISRRICVPNRAINTRKDPGRVR